MIVWQFAQLVFWLNVVHVICSVVLACAVGLIAPPFMLYRLLRSRQRTTLQQPICGSPPTSPSGVGTRGSVWIRSG